VRWARISLLLCLLCFVLSPALSQEFSLSVQAQMQSGLLTLRLQIKNCLMEIERLEKLLADTKANDQIFIDSLNQQLEEQKATLEKLSQQLTDSLSYQRRLEISNTLLWVADGVIGVGLVVYGIWKQDWIPIAAGAAMSASCVLHFVIEFP
jgi:septal ring factor EnvC (AmiA/AmiB activator)